MGIVSEVTLKFDDQQILRAIKESQAEALNKAAVYLVGKMKQNMGSEGGGVLRKQKWAYKTKQFVSRDSRGNFIVTKVRLVARGKQRSVGGAQIKRTSRNVYFASPPGSFPGVRTGLLRNSIDFEAATAESLYALVGTGQKNGRWQEFGTMHKNQHGALVRMPARPWCKRTLNEQAKNLAKVFQDQMGYALARRLPR